MRDVQDVLLRRVAEGKERVEEKEEDGSEGPWWGGRSTRLQSFVGALFVHHAGHAQDSYLTRAREKLEEWWSKEAAAEVEEAAMRHVRMGVETARGCCGIKEEKEAVKGMLHRGRVTHVYVLSQVAKRVKTNSLQTLSGPGGFLYSLCDVCLYPYVYADRVERLQGLSIAVGAHLLRALGSPGAGTLPVAVAWPSALDVPNRRVMAKMLEEEKKAKEKGEENKYTWKNAMDAVCREALAACEPGDTVGGKKQAERIAEEVEQRAGEVLKDVPRSVTQAESSGEKGARVKQEVKREGWARALAREPHMFVRVILEASQARVREGRKPRSWSPRAGGGVFRCLCVALFFFRSCMHNGSLISRTYVKCLQDANVFKC